MTAAASLAASVTRANATRTTFIVVLADAGRHDRQRSRRDERPAPATGGIMTRLILLAFAASVPTQPATAKGHALMEPDLLDRRIA